MSVANGRQNEQCVRDIDGHLCDWGQRVPSVELGNLLRQLGRRVDARRCDPVGIRIVLLNRAGSEPCGGHRNGRPDVVVQSVAHLQDDGGRQWSPTPENSSLRRLCVSGTRQPEPASYPVADGGRSRTCWSR